MEIPQVDDLNVRARSGDPETSKDAGARVTKLRASQALVLQVFRAYGSMSDRDLLDRVHATEKALGLTRLMSPSGVRSRRSELSKPNMERLRQIEEGLAMEYADNAEGLDAHCRAQLRREGVRSPLWDTGRRETIDGRTHIVWGLAV